MKFVIPYSYRIEFMRRHHRTVEEGVRTTTIKIDVEEVEVIGRPLYEVGHAEIRSTHAAWCRFPAQGDRLSRVWSIDGELYVEYCAVEHLIDRLKYYSNNPFDVQTWSGARASTFAYSDGLYARISDEVANTAPMRFWKDDLGEAKGELIQRRASAMRVVDGYLCVVVNEPLLSVINTDGYGYALVVAEGITHTPDGFRGMPEFPKGRRFRLECMRQAAEYLERSMGGRSSVGVGRFPADRIFFPQEVEHLHDDVTLLVNILRPHLGWLQSEIVMAWRALRDALDTCPPLHVAPHLLPALASMLSVIESSEVDEYQDARRALHAAALKERGCSPLEYEIARTVYRAVDLIRDSLGEWDTRPRNDEEWCEEALAVASIGGVYQVLSRFELANVGRRMQISRERLEEAHRKGLHVVHGERGGERGPFVAFLGSDLEVVEILGIRGHDLSKGDLADIKAFAAANALSKLTQDTLAELVF